MSRRRVVACGVLILLLGLLLRVRHASERDGIWRDEAQAAYITHESSDTSELVAKLGVEGHPPLPYLLDRLAQQRWGLDHDLRRRVPIFFGVLTVLGVMLLGWWTFGPRCALFAGLFVAMSPFFIYYSAEVRPYALFGLLCVVHAFAYLAYLKRPGYLAEMAQRRRRREDETLRRPVDLGDVRPTRRQEEIHRLVLVVVVDPAALAPDAVCGVGIDGGIVGPERHGRNCTDCGRRDGCVVTSRPRG